MATKLNAELVNHIVEDCSTDSENGALKVEGILHHFLFNAVRIEGYRNHIEEMLAELPDAFMKGKGGGWSFLNLCMDRHDNQWADLHETMEKLVVLGIATGRVSYVMPRDLWPSLPGGMPYIVVDDLTKPAAAVGVDWKVTIATLDEKAERYRETARIAKNINIAPVMKVIGELRRRYDSGERSRMLHDEIMDLE